MARKVNLSVGVNQLQAEWLDEQDESNSELIRVALDEAYSEKIYGEGA